MNTLILDRSTDAQSAAFTDGSGGVDAVSFDGADCRSGDWAARVRDFLGVRRPDRIVVGTGPGSFAGIRAAIAFAQGYALGSGCAVMGIPSPCALARENRLLAAVGDARRGRFWIALFDGFRPLCDIFQTGEDDLRRSVPERSQVVSPDDARIGPLLGGVFGADYAGWAVPAASGLARYIRENPSSPVPDPRPLYLNPAVRV